MKIRNQSIAEIRDAIANAKPGKFSDLGIDLIIDAVEEDEDGILPRCTDRLAEEFTEWEHVHEFADSIGMQYQEDLTWDEIDTSESHRGADDYFIQTTAECILDEEIPCTGTAVVFKFANGVDQ